MVRKSKRQNFSFFLVITLVLLLAYSNSFRNSFQHDDIHAIVSNPYIKDPGNITQFFADPKMGSGIYGETSSGYRPFLVASFCLNYLSGGLDVIGYHLVNFFVHVVCTFFVYLVTLVVCRNTGPVEQLDSPRYHFMALFAALVFGLHPVQTESVTYITGRSSSLMALFWLASFFTFLQCYFNRKAGYLLLSSLAYACALFSKETAITLLPIVFFFTLMFPRGKNFKARCFPLLLYSLLTLLYLGIRTYFFGSLQYGSQPVRPFLDNLFSQFPAWVHYLGTLLLPLNLNVDYDFPVSHSIMEGRVIVSLLLLSAVCLLVSRLSRSNRAVGFFGLWLAVNLFPTNSIIPLEDLVADRWLYLSCAAYAALLALGADWIFQARLKARGRGAKIVFFCCCALAIEFYGFSTLLRNFDWSNQRTLWEDAVAKSPGKARPYNGLGLALVLQGRLEEAKGAFQKAISLEPRGGQPYLNLAYIYNLQGDWDSAIEYYTRAIPLCPRLLSDIYGRMGLAYFRQGKMGDSEKYSRKAIEIRPHNALPYYILGLHFEANGDIEQAISYVEKANKLDPDYLLPYDALSRLYRENGSNEKSQEAYQKFLKLSSR